MIDVEKSAANERNFPPTGLRKLPHTIFKMAAINSRGRAGSVVHFLGIGLPTHPQLLTMKECSRIKMLLVKMYKDYPLYPSSKKNSKWMVTITTWGMMEMQMENLYLQTFT